MSLTPEQAEYLLDLLKGQEGIARTYYGLAPTQKQEDLKAALREIADPIVCTCMVSAQTGKRRPTPGCRFHQIPEQCQCWNEGQWGRVHREDCPIHAGNPLDSAGNEE